MGWNLEMWSVSARLSSHNSEQDEIDEKLWEELKAKLSELINDPRYESISPMDN